MKNMITIFGNSVRHGRMYLLLSLGIGLLLCFLFQLFISTLFAADAQAISVGLIDRDDSKVSADFKAYITEDMKMKIGPGSDLEHLKTELVEKHISAIVIVPNGFETTVLAGVEPGTDTGTSGNPGNPSNPDNPIEVIFSDDYQNSEFTRAYFENYADSIGRLAASADGDQAVFETLLEKTRANTADVKTTMADKAFLKQMNIAEALKTIFGFFLMFSFLLAIGITNMIYNDRQGGQYNRIRITKVRPASYISGMWIFGILCAVAIIAVFLLFLLITGYGEGIPLLKTAVLSLVFSAFVAAFGMAAGLYLPTRNSIIAAVIGISTITSMLGGAYFPIDTSPDFMQQIARFMPQYWFNDGFDALVRDGHGDWVQDILVLLLFVLLFLILSCIKFASHAPRRRAVKA
jgi:ABC-2 type transport system permease protein